MSKRKKNKININQKYLAIGILLAIISFVLPKPNILRIILILASIVTLIISLVSNTKFLKKDIKLILLIFCGLLLTFIILDAILVVTFKKIPIFSYNITSSKSTRVYNAIGYRVWQCDKNNYKDLKVDPFYNKGYLCDANDIEEIDSNSFLNSVIENYDLYKNTYIKIKGKISKKNGQNYIEMQPYESTDITVNGYVTFADNITLKILFNNNEAALDKYDIYDEITLVGIIKNLETIDDKYIIYMYDTKIVSSITINDYQISITKDKECLEQNILYQNENNNIYSYCLKDIIVSSKDKNYELPMALSSNKITVESFFEKYNSKEEDLDENILYHFDEYNIIKCNDNDSKDIIIGPSSMQFEDVTCSKNSD